MCQRTHFLAGLAEKKGWPIVRIASGPAVQGVVTVRGDCLFDERKEIVEQSFSAPAADEAVSRIDRPHGNLRGHQGANGIDRVFCDAHGWYSCQPSVTNLELERLLRMRSGMCSVYS